MEFNFRVRHPLQGTEILTEQNTPNYEKPIWEKEGGVSNAEPQILF